MKTVQYLKELNAPQRKYVRRDAHKINDKYVRIQSTLLEYGQKNYSARPSAEMISTNQTTQNKAAPVSLKQSQEEKEQALIAAKQAEEEHLKKLISGMSTNEQKVSFFFRKVFPVFLLKYKKFQF